jgi:hypothetical protein
MVYILDKINGELVASEIVPMETGMTPFKKDGWNFNWRKLVREESGTAYLLRTLNSPEKIEGALHLRIISGMMIMEVLELAPWNIGKTNKRFDFVAGCLIAFGCRESIKIEGAYKGFLVFMSKSNLIEWYVKKYKVELALGQRMFISSENGERLIGEYLNRTKII